MERAGARRLRLPVLQGLLLEVDPALRTDPRKRELLAEAIAKGTERGRLRPPASRKLWSGNPPLPEWVIVERREPAAPATVSGRDYFWRPELRWAAELRFRPGDFEALKQVNVWLRDLPADEPVVPLRERSLEIFGDEKRLEELMESRRLFQQGRLTLDLLRARVVHPPFVFEEISPAPMLLVIENHHTFDSFVRALRKESPESGVGVVAYGAGNAFVGSVTYVADLRQRIEEIRYFGDIDADGLRTPIEASRVAVATGLPEVRPAAGLYHLLFRIGRVVDGARPVPSTAARRLAGWLPEPLRPKAEALLAAGKRVAQEALGFKQLATIESDNVVSLD